MVKNILLCIGFFILLSVFPLANIIHGNGNFIYWAVVIISAFGSFDIFKGISKNSKKLDK